MNSSSYVLHGGVPGRERMRLIANVMRPGTLAFLSRAATSMTGSRVLDLGCGGGDVTLELARLVGPEGSVVGIDFDEEKLAIAQDEAINMGFRNVRYCAGDIQSPDFFGTLGASFDVIYARFLLSHLTDPDLILKSIVKSLAPGGQLLVEDVDFGSTVCDPKSWAFDLYLDLYKRAAQKRGVDPEIGAKLGERMTLAGFNIAGISEVHPLGRERDIKLTSALTLNGIADSVVADGLVSADLLASAIDELHRLADDMTTVMSTPRIVQICGIA